MEVFHGGETYAVCRVNGGVRVLSGVCPHAGGPLGEGALHGTLLACPYHGWEFDCTTGVCAMDDTVSVPAFRVRLEGDEILADLPEAGARPADRA